MPPPCRKHQNHTWALLHGTTLRTSQLILLEGKIRPANWSYNKNFQRCDMPTFGAFYLGREVSNSDKTFPDWAAKEFMDTTQKKGKGQQDVVLGPMYRGACQHTFKAGGNEMAQLSVAEKGLATTSEKYTIADCPQQSCWVKFIALKWQNLQDHIDVEESSSDTVTATTAASGHGLRIDTQVVDRTNSRQQFCRCVSLDLFGTTRKPELTFHDISRATWTSF